MSNPLQTLPSTGDITTSLLGWLVVIVVVGWVVTRVLDIDVLGALPVIGDSSGGGGGGSTGGLGLGGTLAGVRSFATSTTGLLIIGASVVSGLVLTGAIQLPAGTGVQFVVLLELFAFYLGLQWFDAYSFPLFALVSGVVTVLALSALGEPVLSTVVNSRAFPIIVVIGGYLAVQWVRDATESDRPRIVLEGREE